MPASIKRKKSKRMTCRRKYKIIRKVAEHRRKVRREQRKNPKHNKPKDPGVPNSLPFKEEILQEAEQRKQRAQALKESQKANRLKLQLQNRGIDEMIELAKGIDEDVKRESKQKDNGPKEKVLDLKTASKDLKMLVEDADVILEVLDARDPIGCRCPQLEELVIKSNKKLILVLNKIDLIPRKNLEEWLQFFRQSVPTIAFKSSTPVSLTNAGKGKKRKGKFQRDAPTVNGLSRCIGASLLMKILGNYCRGLGDQSSIKVGVVGFPSVGKRSLISSLNKSSCPVETSPLVQEKAVNKRVKILDSPGVVLSSDSTPVVLALRNMVRLDTLNDVLSPAEAIVERADHTQLCLHYTVPDFGSGEELFTLLAKRMGKFRKGGIPNVAEGAKRLINDWNRGVIKYYTRPPQVPESEMTEQSEFEINAQEEETEFLKVQEMFASKGVEVAASAPTDCTSLVNEEDSMDVGTEVEETQSKKKSKNKKGKKIKSKK